MSPPESSPSAPPGRGVLAGVSAIAAALFLAIGVGVLALQNGREGPGLLIAISYVDGLLYLSGAVIYLYAATTNRERRLLITGAALLTAAVAVPTTFSLMYPLLVPMWISALKAPRDATPAP